MVEKRYETAAQTLADLRDQGVIHDGMTVMVGGCDADLRYRVQG